MTSIALGWYVKQVFALVTFQQHLNPCVLAGEHPLLDQGGDSCIGNAIHLRSRPWCSHPSKAAVGQEGLDADGEGSSVEMLLFVGPM